MRLHTLTLTALSLVSLSLSACGGGSGADLNQTGFGAVRVEGLSYATATKNSVTGPGGSFEYEPGEQIELRIGDTVLGSAPAREFLTTADLVPGLEIPTTNNELGRLLSARTSHIGRRWINLLVFLHTVDADGDTSNGIQIPEQLPALLSGVQLDFDRSVDHFNQDIALRTMLRDGAAAGLWNGVRPLIRLPLKTASVFYEAGEIPHQFEAYVESTSDQDADGVADYHTTVSYFGDERVDFRSDQDADEMFDSSARIDFDAYGRVTNQESDYDFDGTPENRNVLEYHAEGELYRETSYDGPDIQNRVTHFYDDLGLESREETDEGGDGTVDTIRSFAYNSVGRLTRVDRDDDANGVLNYITHYRYDARGYIRLYEEDTNADGTINRRTTYVTDSLGRRRFTGRDNDVDGIMENITRKIYDDVARTQREERETSGVLDRVTLIYYDAVGRIVRIERDADADGTVDRVNTSTYEAARIVEEQDEGADGTIDRRDIQELTPGGNTQRYLDDGDADGTIDSIETTRWVPFSALHLLQFGRV